MCNDDLLTDISSSRRRRAQAPHPLFRVLIECVKYDLPSAHIRPIILLPVHNYVFACKKIQELVGERPVEECIGALTQL